jgi:hypothetical protein
MKLYGVNDNYGANPPEMEVFEVESESKRQYKLKQHGKGSGYRLIVRKDELRLMGYSEAEAWGKYVDSLQTQISRLEDRIKMNRIYLGMVPEEFQCVTAVKGG